MKGLRGLYIRRETIPHGSNCRALWEVSTTHRQHMIGTLRNLEIIRTKQKLLLLTFHHYKFNLNVEMVLLQTHYFGPNNTMIKLFIQYVQNAGKCCNAACRHFSRIKKMLVMKCCVALL